MLDSQSAGASRSRALKLLIGVVTLAFVVGPTAALIALGASGRLSRDIPIAEIASYAAWTFAAVAFSKWEVVAHPVATQNQRRTVPVRLAVLGLSAGAALLTYILTIGSTWYASGFASALWVIASVPGVMRLGVAPAVAATACLAMQLTPETAGSWTPVRWESMVAVSMTLAFAFIFLDRPTVPQSMWAHRLRDGDADGHFPLFQGLTLAVGDRIILDDQSLTVHAGEIVVLMGPSGVGKSVLSDVVFGLEGRLSDVTVSGEIGVAPALGGLVFQAGGGLPHLSVDGNLRLVSSDRKRRRALAGRFGLKIRQKSSTLSGGERRRIAFIRPMLASRPLLWLDEPETGLDLRRVDQLAELLKQQADEGGMGIVVSTHNPGFAEAIADRIVFLGNDGYLVELGVNAGAGALDAVAERVTQLLSVSAVEQHLGRGKRLRAGLNRVRVGLRRGRRRLLDCLGQPVESVPFLLHYFWLAPSRSTMVRAFELSWLRGALYYPFIGAIFGLVIALTFHFVGAYFVVSGATVVQHFGPEMVVRLAPLIAAILVGSAAGSTIAAWLGEMSVERHLDALEVLGVSTRRWILGPAWWGLFVAALLHAVAFAAAIVAVFVAYVWHEKGGEFWLQLANFMAGFEARGGFGARLRNWWVTACSWLRSQSAVPARRCVTRPRWPQQLPGP